MCLIIHKKRGKLIPEHLVQSANTDNPHGIGIAWRDNHRVLVEKGLEIGAALSLLDRLGKSADLVIHFRLATHGPQDGLRTHPFPIRGPENSTSYVTDRGVLFHNGIVLGYGSATQSDTEELVESTLSKLPTSAMLKLLNSLDSKFLLFSAKSTVRVGHWEKHRGLWLSNTHSIRGGYFGYNNDYDWNNRTYWEYECFKNVNRRR
jgi:predicted glutamine amidotransferase